MKDLQDHRPRRSTARSLAHVAPIALDPTPTGAPVVGIGRAKSGLDLTFVVAVVA